MTSISDPSPATGISAVSAITAAPNQAASEVDAVWDPPIPLTGNRVVPAFPVDALPGWVADMVAGVAEFTQTPADLPGCVALAALSTAAGGRVLVEVRGSWREPVNQYTVVALPPGSRKSPVFAALTGPLLAAERELVERTKLQIIEAKVSAAAATEAANRATATAGKAHPDQLTDALAEATAAAMNAEAITIPVEPQLIADDITPESAATLLAEQGGRLAVLSAEGGIFATLAGRYSGVANLEVFLKGHAGDMLRVNRKGRNAEHVTSPALTLGLCVQPDVLRDIATMPGFRGRGLLARILFSVPENTVGRRRIGTAPVSTDVVERYGNHLTALVTSLAEWTDPAVLVLTPEAGKRVLTIEETVEPRLAPGGDWAHIVDWGSKYTGAVVRLAALLHLAEHHHDGWSKPIEANTIERAAQLGDYFAAHALAAFEDMGADPLVDDARAVLDWIERNQPEQFSRRELFTGVSRGRFRKVAQLDPVLSLLEQHGHIRALPPPEPTGRGRPPAPVYLVNPVLTGRSDQWRNGS
ncbi:MAG: YfjI family protein [Stackebrandtia sp.]